MGGVTPGMWEMTTSVIRHKGLPKTKPPFKGGDLSQLVPSRNFCRLQCAVLNGPTYATCGTVRLQMGHLQRRLSLGFQEDMGGKPDSSEGSVSETSTWIEAPQHVPIHSWGDRCRIVLG